MRICFPSVILVLAGSAWAAAQEPVITFDQVQPVLKKRCGSCHGGSMPRGDLDVSTPDRIRAGSATGPVVVAGKPEASLLFTLTAHLEDPKMPPGAPKIPKRELELIHGWIAGGLQERPKPAVAKTPTKTPTSPAPAASMKSPAPLTVPVTPLDRPTALTALAAHPTNNLLALSGMQQIVLCDAASRQPIHAFPFPEGEVHNLQFSADGEWLVAAGGIGGESGKVVVFEQATGTRLAEFPEESDVALTVDLSADRQWLAYGGPGRSITLIRMSDRQVQTTFTGPTDWVLSVAFSPDGLLLAAGDRFGAIRVWETQTGKLFAMLRGHTGAVTSLAWSPEGDRLLSVGEDATARLWNLHTNEPLALWEPAIGGLQAVEWSPAGPIALAGRSKQVALYQPTGERLGTLDTDDEAIAIAFSPAAGHIAVADAAGGLQLFAVQSAENLGALNLPLATSTEPLAKSRPPRVRPVPETPPSVSVASAPSGSQTDDAALLQAVRDAEAAVEATEKSLDQLKTTAAKLRQLLNDRRAPSSPAK